MTFQETVNLQMQIINWIDKNLKATKRFNTVYGRSKILFQYLQKEIPEANHEDFKQAMARCGYFANTENTNDEYAKVIFNVSEKSVRKLMKKSPIRSCNFL